MKYIFLVTLFFTQVFAGSSSSVKKNEVIIKSQEKQEMRIEKKKKLMQVLPVKINRKDRFIEGQVIKIAVRHISLAGDYNLAIGEVNPKVIKHIPIENLEITVINNKTLGIELRIFELQRNTLVKKISAYNISREKFLQNVELMFTKLFIGAVVEE